MGIRCIGYLVFVVTNRLYAQLGSQKARLNTSQGVQVGNAIPRHTANAPRAIRADSALALEWVRVHYAR